MIQLDRSTVREPRTLKRLREAGLKHARKFFVDTPITVRRQQRYFNPHWAKAYGVPIPALVRLFHGKCAFCESQVDSKLAGVLDHLRPKWSTRGLGREYAPDHYWWLAFAWDNLYLACPDCNKNRGPRFPVKGKRISGPGDDPADEQPLLLDPCADDPAAHLRFDESGRVCALSARGDVTIKLVALNRSTLITRRRRAIEEVNGLWRSGLGRGGTVPPDLIAQLNDLISPHAEYSACTRAAVTRRLARANARTSEAFSGLVLGPAASHDRKHVVRSSASQLAPRFIDRVRLENFRGIRQLTVCSPSSDQSNQDWLVLIGENAAGKSSILQAIALNLMSDADRRKLVPNPKRFIKRGAPRAMVEVQFRSDEVPRRLTITRRGFTCSAAAAGAPLMAYGATRLPPLAGGPTRRATLENLFNPFAPMLDPVTWLLKLARGGARDRADFDYAARALAALLPGRPRKWRFRAAGKDIVVEPEGPLRELSDGYQSVIALACDMMATVHHSFRGGMESTEGIVLIDELGAQLHPQWKMRLTKVLRQAFPRLQCIATTHDPLCLRGLRNGEVVTIEKTPRGRVFTRTDLPPIEGMQVDQILQSEYFGLRSALDPDIEAQFERMYRLKAKPSQVLTASQRKELAHLEEHLARYDVLGSTRAERLMLSEITRFLARERTLPQKSARDREWAAAQAQIGKRLETRLGVSV